MLRTNGWGLGRAIGARVIVPVILLLTAVLVVLFAEPGVNGRRKPAVNANDATAEIVQRARSTVERIDRRLAEQTGVAPDEIAAMAPSSVQADVPKPVPRIAVVQPLAATPDPIDSATLTVSAIFWNPRSPLAAVNGRLVEVGKDVEGLRVVVIEKEAVVFEGPTKKRRTFHLYSEADSP
jgi:hypothetical protein